MSTRTRRTVFILSVLAAVALGACAVTRVNPVVAAEKGIKKDDARKLIAAVSILELNKAVVTVKEISPPGAVVSVLANIKLGFRFARGEAGGWRVVEVRTGDRQWESFDVLARSLGGDNISMVRAELDAFAAELDALATNKSKQAKNGQTAADNQSQPPKELKRGALSVKEPAAALAPLGSSAVVELEVEVSVDFVRDGRGRWQISRVRFGSGGGGGQGFAEFDAFERALNAEKLTRARADLDTLALALEAYRSARGFYVVGETAAVLIDHLNPRYTPAFIRVDPWHRPYEYEGTRERFTLRSLGADGKAGTTDDVTIRKG
jgi:hypothetical protein